MKQKEVKLLVFELFATLKKHLPLCRAYPIVGYCGSFLNKLPSQKKQLIPPTCYNNNQSSLPARVLSTIDQLAPSPSSPSRRRARLCSTWLGPGYCQARVRLRVRVRARVRVRVRVRVRS